MVNFGEDLNQRRNPAHRLHYLDYEGLKRALYKDKESSTGMELAAMLDTPNAYAAELTPHHAPPASSHFFSLLEVEIHKVNSFVGREVAQLRSSLDALQELARRSGAEREQLWQEASKIEAGLIEVDRFIRMNLTGFRKIAKKFDKVHDERAGSWLGARLSSEPFTNVQLEGLLLILGKLHAEFRAADGAVAAGGATAALRKVEFKRQTTKYWVRSEDQMEVLARIMRQLPVVEHPLAQRKAPSDAASAAGRRGAGAPLIGQWVSSVYFDSPSFESYKRRLRMEDGAELYRVRFYGQTPEETPTLFVERKTHREKWTGESSVKVRMPLPPEHASAYLAGRQLDLPGLCAAAAARGALPTTEIAHAAELGVEWQKAHGAMKLTPAVRTIYRRIPFQTDAQATIPLRITFDTSLQLFREPPTPEDATPTPGGAWCAQLTDSFDEAASFRRFPHAILEIKVGGDNEQMPPWLNELLASGLLTPMPKFSKYLTGCAAHYHSQLDAIPDWFAQPSLGNFLAAPQRPLLDGDGAFGGAAASASSSLASSSLTSSLTSSTTSSTHVAAAARHKKVGSSRPTTSAQVVPSGAQATRASSGAARAGHRAAGDGGRRTPFGGLLGMSRGRSAGGPAVRLIDRTAGTGRADPKTFFANERTFIQWLSAGMLLLSVGIALIEFKAAQLLVTSTADNTDNGAATDIDPVTGASTSSSSTGGPVGTLADYAAGVLICTMALVIVAYGLIVYLWRLRKLQRRDSGGYADPFGPPVVVTAVFVAVIIYVSSHLSRNLSLEVPVTVQPLGPND